MNTLANKDESSIAPVALIGSDGMLGHAWRTALTQRGLAFREFRIDQIDLTRPQTLTVLEAVAPAYVVNCAAYTDVDGAEVDEQLAHAVNAEGVAHLAKTCRRLETLLIHYSTDHVFPGDSDDSYAVDSPTEPINAYGRSKLAGEAALRESNCSHLLIRTSWLYAPWGTNFVRTIARLAGQSDVVRVVTDQRARPTSAEHLAEASIRLMVSGATGTWHVTDGGSCTRFEWARETVRLLGSNCRVEPCLTDVFPRPATRPACSNLDIGKTERRIGDMPSWQDNLASVVRRLDVAATDDA